MADNIENVKIPAGVWVDLYAEAGLPIGEIIAVENIGGPEVRLAISATEPTPDHTAYNILRRESEILRNSEGDLGAWAYSNNVNSVVAVRSIANGNGFYPELTQTGAGASGPSVVGLKDSSNDRIDPATSQKQLPDNHNVTVSNQLTQPTTPIDTQPVSAATLPLPSGAATSENQLPDNHQVSVSNLLPDNHSVTISNQLTQPTTPADTQPVSAASLPLPAGAATAANQLPDGHAVEVNNLPSDYATAAKQLPDNHNVTVSNPIANPTDFPDQGAHDRIDSVTGQSRHGEDVIRVIQATTPEDNGTKFFFNDEFGVNMNQDGIVSASLVESDWIHGGGASGEATLPEVAWTESQTVGSGIDFSATQVLFDPPPNSGIFYHDIRSASDESVWQFVADGDVPDSTHLEFYLYIQRWENQDSRQIEMRLKNGAVDVGFVQLRNYIDRTGSLNQWQLIRIPLSDFSPTGTWDTLEFTLKHQRVDVCTDDIRLLNAAVETADIVFEVAPDDGDKLIIDTLRFSFVDQVGLNVLNGAANVDYDALGAIPALANGLLYQRISNGSVITSFAVRRLWDLMRVPATTLETHIGGAANDSVMFLVTSHFARPLVLDSANGDKLTYTLRDDMSGLNEFNISVGAGRITS